ncbi:hypothetical protein BX600DRAFT_495449 [Xylariales sp. PMI_506]|nr:hypothetical protein BX600DRAFT_495449 [Xylariales sp. PMI_506]
MLQGLEPQALASLSSSILPSVFVTIPPSSTTSNLATLSTAIASATTTSAITTMSAPDNISDSGTPAWQLAIAGVIPALVVLAGAGVYMWYRHRLYQRKKKEFDNIGTMMQDLQANSQAVAALSMTLEAGVERLRRMETEMYVREANWTQSHADYGNDRYVSYSLPPPSVLRNSDGSDPGTPTRPPTGRTSLPLSSRPLSGTTLQGSLPHSGLGLEYLPARPAHDLYHSDSGEALESYANYNPPSTIIEESSGGSLPCESVIAPYKSPILQNADGSLHVVVPGEQLTKPERKPPISSLALFSPLRSNPSHPDLVPPPLAVVKRNSVREPPAVPIVRLDKKLLRRSASIPPSAGSCSSITQNMAHHEFEKPTSPFLTPPRGDVQPDVGNNSVEPAADEFSAATGESNRSLLQAENRVSSTSSTSASYCNSSPAVEVSSTLLPDNSNTPSSAGEGRCSGNPFETPPTLSFLSTSEDDTTIASTAAATVVSSASDIQSPEKPKTPLLPPRRRAYHVPRPFYETEMGMITPPPTCTATSSSLRDRIPFEISQPTKRMSNGSIVTVVVSPLPTSSDAADAATSTSENDDVDKIDIAGGAAPSDYGIKNKHTSLQVRPLAYIRPPPSRIPLPSLFASPKRHSTSAVMNFSKPRQHSPLKRHGGAGAVIIAKDLSASYPSSQCLPTLESCEAMDRGAAAGDANSRSADGCRGFCHNDGDDEDDDKENQCSKCADDFLNRGVLLREMSDTLRLVHEEEDEE